MNDIIWFLSCKANNFINQMTFLDSTIFIQFVLIVIIHISKCHELSSFNLSIRPNISCLKELCLTSDHNYRFMVHVIVYFFYLDQMLSGFSNLCKNNEYVLTF